MTIRLRKTQLSDLNNLFEIQKDRIAVAMAAFTAKDPSDKDAYLEKWTRLLKDNSINSYTITKDKEVIGSVCKYLIKDEPELTYGILKSEWGKGFASVAVNLFLEVEKVRPLNARAAFDNIGSQRVLEKNGFRKVGSDIGYANARQKEILEFIYKLE